MNKKIIAIFVSLLVIALLAAPVLAKPTNGPNKVAVSVIMTRNDGGGPGLELSPDVATGPINHRHRLQGYDVTITFEDSSTLMGTLLIERKIVQVPQKGLVKVILTDNYVFDFGVGGFEGNGQVLLDQVKGQSLAWGLFHGTGDFEGQTLNIGHPWEAYGGGAPNPWVGYWLKCSVYP